jgi:hypothetical protein
MSTGGAASHRCGVNWRSSISQVRCQLAEQYPTGEVSTGGAVSHRLYCGIKKRPKPLFIVGGVYRKKYNLKIPKFDFNLFNSVP